MYDSLFQGPRPYNRAVYKALFTDEVIKLGPLAQAVINPSKPIELKQKSDGGQSAYENYKKH